MIRHVWSVLCQRSVIDRDTNNLSMFDSLEQLTLHGPLVPGQVIPLSFDLVTLWARESNAPAAKGRARVTLVMPSGRTRRLSDLEIDLTTVSRTRHRVLGRGLEVEPGRFEFNVEIQEEDGEWRQAALIPLDVTLAPIEVSSPVDASHTG